MVRTHEERLMLLEAWRKDPSLVTKWAQDQVMYMALLNEEVMQEPGGGRSAWQARATAMKQIESLIPKLLEHLSDEKDQGDGEGQIPLHSGPTDAEPWEGDPSSEEVPEPPIMEQASVQLPDGDRSSNK